MSVLIWVKTVCKGHAVLLFAYFLKLTFSNNSFRNTIRVSNSLNLDQEQTFCCPDLGPNCLQGLSAPAGNTSRQRYKYMRNYPAGLNVYFCLRLHLLSRFLHASNKVSGKTVCLPGLIQVFTGRLCLKVQYLMNRLIFLSSENLWGLCI